MRTALTLSASLVLAWPIAAQNNCNIELKPLKPLTPVGCADTMPACICNPSGIDCHWTWACVSFGTPSGADATIPLQGRPPQATNPLEMMRQLQRLRQIQQQNELLRQQAAPQDASIAVAPSPPVPTQPWKTGGLVNGRAWQSFSQDEKVVFLTGASDTFFMVDEAEFFKNFPRGLQVGEFALAIDQFYREPENLPIPVFFGLKVVTMKVNGEDPAVVDKILSAVRQSASGPKPPESERDVISWP
jgi:hypothetical protein